MISIVLYGRNDAHGYNLHRRAALSLNCLAEVLTDDDDEIVFVDYNTPDELPTFIEAIADTLTPRCLDVLRVLRVPAALHRERFARLTHLPARRASVPQRGGAPRESREQVAALDEHGHDPAPARGEASATSARDLADGFYGLPDSSFPSGSGNSFRGVTRDVRCRSSSARASPCGSTSRRCSNEWVRFDAPGDFQLCLREDFVAIDGCDEDDAARLARRLEPQPTDVPPSRLDREPR